MKRPKRFIHTNIHTYLLTYIHTYLHTYILTYIHTYLLKYILTNQVIVSAYADLKRVENVRFPGFVHFTFRSGAPLWLTL